MNVKENIKTIIVKKPLKLDCGKTINNYHLAYETYGTLNEKKDNAILVFHALSGDQFVSGTNPITNKSGWWSYAVGPDKAIDTNKFFVICANVIGGCMGSYGPNSIDPITNKTVGTNFPVVTINDMVNAQYNLLEFFKIDKLFSVTGGSMGGMQVLQFVANFPDKTKTAIPIACTASHSAQNIALNELGITDLDNYLVGSTAVAVAADEVSAARELANFKKEVTKDKEYPTFKAGIVAGELMDVEQLIKLAELPTKDQLISMVLQGFNAPITGFVGTLQAIIKKFVYVVDAIAEKEEKK